jgi:hypothetical protein
LSLQRCEGKKLESVLEEVRSRFGDSVTIVEANRLRKGGVGGFFAKETFEVVVDVDEEPPDEPGGATEIPAEFGLQATEDFCERLLSMADSVNDAAPAPAPTPSPASTVSTEQPAFSAVLDSITRHMETEQPPPPEAPGRRLFLRTPFAESLPAPAPAPADAAVFEPAPVVERLTVPVRTPVPEPQPGIDNRALARIGLPEDLRRAALTWPAPAVGADPSTWLLGLLNDLPQPEDLPRGKGSVIVVTGVGDAALDLARAIVDELDLDEESLLIASPGRGGPGRAIPAHRRLRDADAAAETRRSWRRRSRPTVVAVAAPPGRQSQWARSIIDALEPTMVWAAVEATRKPEDLIEWSEELGGFDALAVSDVEDTVSPAAVLQCGIPVGRVDGRPATPLLWASLLAPRLAA